MAGSAVRGGSEQPEAKGTMPAGSGHDNGASPACALTGGNKQVPGRLPTHGEPRLSSGVRVCWTPMRTLPPLARQRRASSAASHAETGFGASARHPTRSSSTPEGLTEGGGLAAPVSRRARASDPQRPGDAGRRVVQGPLLPSLGGHADERTPGQSAQPSTGRIRGQARQAVTSIGLQLDFGARQCRIPDTGTSVRKTLRATIARRS